jgi:VWFA-related protein
MTRRVGWVLAAGVLLAVSQPGATATSRQSQPPPGQDGQPAETPRFRGGANLVRIDAYVTADGQPVRDLTIDDFEVLEDNVPQRLESFQLVQPRPPAPDTAVREPQSVAESLTMARDPEARLFVLFMDIWHVQLEGSHRAQGPLTRLLDRTIGQDDLVGVMHPAMAARSMALGRRMTSIAGILKEHWYWGERGTVLTSDPREQEIQQCYPDAKDTMGIAHEMIRRRRETRTLRALEDLIRHLENVREERKFVFLLTEGWILQPQDQSLARTLKVNDQATGAPPPPAVGVDPQGRLRLDPRDQGGTFGSCERERSLLAHTDHRAEFELLIQRANRANVSFYPIDFRGLVGFDEPINSTRALTMYGPASSPSADAGRLGARQDGLRVLAENTDGHAVLNSTSFDRDLGRIVADTGAYYLLGYYSTNTKLDGKYRRLTVRVKRPDLAVRSRPGYLAPTEAEMASSRVEALMNGAPPGHTTIPASVVRAFEGLAPIRGTVPLRVQTASSPSQIWITGELDVSVARLEEWQKGGRVRAVLEHEAGARAPVHSEGKLEAGQRNFLVTLPPGITLAPGRYVVRVELLAADSTAGLQTTADAFVPDPHWLVSVTGLTTRRGPSTGLQYVPTADTRFRRTERLRLEIPRSTTDGKASARLLGRDGQPLPMPIALSERIEEKSGQRMILVDMTLAPLAQGEYAVEISVEHGDRKESATYAFRIIP